MVQQAHHKIFIRKLLGSKVFLFFVILALIWLALGVGRESYRKYQLTKEINSLKSEITRLEGSNQQLSSLMEYFQDESYLEKEARLKLNLKKPGEKVVVVPEGSLPQQISSGDDSIINQFEGFNKGSVGSGQIEVEIPNWWKWWEYFFHFSPNL